MELALAALPGVVTSCLLAWVLIRLLDKQNEERQAHRIEVSTLTQTQAEQIAALLAEHRREVADLCQRLQAPLAAVVAHDAREAGPDPVPFDLEDDLSLIEQRERQMEEFARELEGRA